MSLVKKAIAEFFGTFILVLIGCGTACAVGCDARLGAGYLITALAFGVGLIAACYSVGNLSGCHINPAVSLSKLITGTLKPVEFICYVVGQCLGALAAAGILRVLFADNDRTGALGSNGLYNGSIGLSLLVEIVLTCVFVLVVLYTSESHPQGSASGLVIGLALTAVHLLGIALTGTSVNPARSLGPALIAGGDALKVVWVFWVGPLVGAAVAAVLFRVLNDKKAK